LPLELRQKVDEALIETRASFMSNLEKAESFVQKSLLIPIEIKDLSSKDFKTVLKNFNKILFLKN